jgi:hypothetical protein
LATSAAEDDWAPRVAVGRIVRRLRVAASAGGQQRKKPAEYGRSWSSCVLDPSKMSRLVPSQFLNLAAYCSITNLKFIEFR